MSFRLMKERIKQSGKSLYEEQVKDAQNILADGFIDDVSCSKHIFFWIAGENPQKGNQIYIKFYDRKYSSANGNTKLFLTHNNDKIEVGDYIYDEEENTYWICTESFHVDNIYYKGKFTQCNWYLRWQRPDGTILEYPCLDLNSTQYNSGESGNSTLKLGSAQHMEKVQANNDTISLSSPQRFYISRDNSIPYIITQNDTTASNYGKGICNITVTQDVRHEDKDRPDLVLCDYIDLLSHLPPPLPSEQTTDSNNEKVDSSQVENKNVHLKISYDGDNYIFAGGEYKTFTVIASDNNGDLIDDVSVQWSITALPEVKKYISYEILENNSLKIKSFYHASVIGTKILLTVSVNEISESIYVEIGGGI